MLFAHVLFNYSEKLWLYVLGISNVYSVQFCNGVLWFMLVRPDSEDLYNRVT